MPHTAGSSQIGPMMRHWRTARRLSQLQLALAAGISSKHRSFIETGRSQPSRDTVLRLAKTLDLPLRDRNTLLEAAGYSRLYRETPLSAPDMAQVRRVMEFMLKQLEPHPTVAIDRHWNILAGNRAHYGMLALLAEEVPDHVARNLMRLAFHPAGLRASIVNWDLVGRVLVDRIHRELSAGLDDETRQLVDELLSYPDVPASWGSPDFNTHPTILLPLHLRKGELDIKLCTTITTIGTAQDITLQELRIESFFPADEASGHVLRAMLERAGGQCLTQVTQRAGRSAKEA